MPNTKTATLLISVILFCLPLDVSAADASNKIVIAGLQRANLVSLHQDIDVVCEAGRVVVSTSPRNGTGLGTIKTEAFTLARKILELRPSTVLVTIQYYDPHNSNSWSEISISRGDVLAIATRRLSQKVVFDSLVVTHRQRSESNSASSTTASKTETSDDSEDSDAQSTVPAAKSYVHTYAVPVKSTQPKTSTSTNKTVKKTTHRHAKQQS